MLSLPPGVGFGVGIAMVVAVAVLLRLAFRYRLAEASRRARESDRTLVRAIAVLALPASVAVPTIMLAIVLRASPVQGVWIDLTRHLLMVVLIACVVWTLLRTIRALERRVVRAHRIDVADNLEARRIHTQARVLSRTVMGIVLILGMAAVLMTIPGMRQVGAGLLASAGLAGLIAGFAAQPILGNLIAGLQLALAQPIRLDDVVIVEGEWGRIEEITSTYVVVAIWDQRRLVVPLRWFIENPFQNWTRSTSQILGTVMLWLDYRTPMDQVREEFKRICEASAHWDRRVAVVQVVETGEWSMQVRLLVSAANSGAAFDLRCEVREGILAFLQARYPEALPLIRTRPEQAVHAVTGTAHGAGEGPPPTEEPSVILSSREHP